MRIETVLIVNKDSKILLGLKHPKKKFGGRWNGFGGGLKDGESLEECAIRETEKETGITPKNLEKLGIILFKFKTDEQDHEVHFYRAGDYNGILRPTEGFTEYREFSPEELKTIYDDMMSADRHWLPLFVKNEMFGGEAVFDEELNVIYHNINPVDNLN